MKCPLCNEEFLGMRQFGEAYRCTKCGDILCSDCLLKHLHDKHNALQAGKWSFGKFIPTDEDKYY